MKKYEPLKEIKLIIQATFVHFNQMCWPRASGQNLDELVDRLTHGNATGTDFVIAASYISAYRNLTMTTKSRRERICSILQRTEKEAPKRKMETRPGDPRTELLEITMRNKT